MGKRYRNIKGFNRKRSINGEQTNEKMLKLTNSQLKTTDQSKEVLFPQPSRVEILKV